MPPGNVDRRWPDDRRGGGDRVVEQRPLSGGAGVSRHRARRSRRSRPAEESGPVPAVSVGTQTTRIHGDVVDRRALAAAETNCRCEVQCGSRRIAARRDGPESRRRCAARVSRCRRRRAAPRAGNRTGGDWRARCGLAQARLRAGDISEFEAGLSRTDAARLEAARLFRVSARDLAYIRLRTLIGLDQQAATLRLSAPAPSSAGSCGAPQDLFRDGACGQTGRACGRTANRSRGRARRPRKRAHRGVHRLARCQREGQRRIRDGARAWASRFPILSQNQGRRSRARPRRSNRPAGTTWRLGPSSRRMSRPRSSA